MWVWNRRRFLPLDRPGFSRDSGFYLDPTIGGQHLGAGFNFTNILQAAFLDKSVLRSFSLLTVWLCNLWHVEIVTKVACKMLVKLTIGDWRSALGSCWKYWQVLCFRQWINSSWSKRCCSGHNADVQSRLYQSGTSWGVSGILVLYQGQTDFNFSNIHNNLSIKSKSK